jgi:hypothetical protein
MGRPEKSWRIDTGSLYRSLFERDVPLHIEWRPEMKLAVKVPVVPDLMSFPRDAENKIGPSFGVCPENEKRCFHSLLRE